MNARNKTAYFEWLRVFAAAAVVLMHTAGKKWLTIGYTAPGWTELTRWDSLVRWPVLIFIMITGALFLPKKTELKTMLTRYIPRMVVCYLVWSAAYAWFNEKLTLLEVMIGPYHMWYLPFLWGVYLTIPFLQKIAEEDRLMDRLLWVSIVVGLLIPWSAKLGILLMPKQTELLQTLAGRLNYTFFLDYLAILLLGHKLNSTDLTPWQRRIIYALGLAGVLVTYDATVWATELAGTQNSLFFDMMAPNNLSAAAALFVFAKYHLTKLPRVVEAVAKCSFGIYLSHVMIIEHLNDVGHHALMGDPARTVPALSAVVFAAALAVTAVLKCIPVIGKYLT